MSAPAPLIVRVLCILWPSFLMAGVMEMLVFAVVDPAELHWFGAEAIEWSHSTIYSVTFLLFWLVTSLASALTQVLLTLPGDVRSPLHI
jgi:hypothetical protein